MEYTKAENMDMRDDEPRQNMHQCLLHAAAWQMSYLTKYCRDHPVIHSFPSYLQNGTKCYRRMLETVKYLGKKIEESQVCENYRQQALNKCPFISSTNMSTYPIHTVLFDSVDETIQSFVNATCLSNTNREEKIPLCANGDIELPGVDPKAKGKLKPLLPRRITKEKTCYDYIYGREIQKPRKRSIMKVENYKVVLVADPVYVEFRNFKSKALYQKSVFLRNISNSPVRFQLEGRPYRSRFTIVIDPNNESEIIPPGMAVRLIVYFSCDDMYEPEEQLAINVQNGKPVVIKLHGSRDPPILKVIDIPEVQITPAAAAFVHSGTTLSLNETCYHESGRPVQSEQSISSEIEEKSVESECSDISIITRGIPQVIFECQRCFVGEEITRRKTLKNVGGEARFFIMSEIDWYSMHIEDITATNMLILPTFAIEPAYFSLKAQEEICITMHFFPDTYGMHVDTLFLISDNSSVISTEIMGDGVMYEPDFFQFSEKLTRIVRDVHGTCCPRYYLNLGQGTAHDVLSKVFCIVNTSESQMHYRWKKLRPRDVEGNRSSTKDDLSEEVPLDNIDISPNEGIFPPLTVLNFSVTADVPDEPTNRHFAVLQFYVEDIPLASVAKKLRLLTEDSRVKRRTCMTSVDICVSDVEVWIQCMPTDILPCGDADESGTFGECVCGYITGSHTEISAISQYWLYTKPEEILCDAVWRDKFTSQLTIEEGFDYYEVIDTESIASNIIDTIICMGILIPDCPLFVGIKQTYTLILKNFSHQPVTYTWGQPTGFDESKLQICLCPQHGEIPAGDTRVLDVVCLPIEAGPVGHLSIPCYIGMSKNVIILDIECVIESFHVTFYLPPLIENSEGLCDIVRVEWNVNSYKNPVDLSKIHESFPHKVSTHEIEMLQERELMSVNLDEGTALKEAYAGPSAISINSHKEFKNSSTERDIIGQISEIIRESSSEQSFEDRLSECEDVNNVCGVKCIVPYHNTLPPPITESVIIEFLELPLRTVRKRTIIIKNETPIPSSISIRVRNFFPVSPITKDSMKEAVEAICKKVFDRHDDDIWKKLKQPGSGLLVCVDPNKAQLGPYEIVPVNIYVFADTWGVYTDEIQISIVGLPQYTLGICVEVDELPISYPICGYSSTETPIIRFGTLAHGGNTESRKLLLNNTSVLPLSINWYSFLQQPLRTSQSVDSQLLAPFSVILHMYTPFTDELAAKIKTRPESSNERLLKTSLERYMSGESMRFLETFHPVSITDSTVNSQSEPNIRDEILDHPTCPSLKNCCCSDTLTWSDAYSVCPPGCEIPSRNIEAYGEFSENTETSIVASLFNPEKLKKTGFDVSVGTFYGVPGSTYLSIYPEEIFIPPKGTTSITLTILPDKCPITHFDTSLICKIVGFMRIAPSDQRKHGCYSRKDGALLRPLEIKVEARISRSRISYDIPKSDRIFSISADAVMRSSKKSIMLKRVYTFYNAEDSTIYMTFEINKPFQILRIVKCTESPNCKLTGTVCVGGKEEIRVEISCCVTSQFIGELLESNMGRNSHSSVIKFTGTLFITHTDKSIQVLDLILKVQLPALNLSSYKLNFGFVHVGDTKQLILLVENNSAYVQSFRARKKGKNEEFSISDHAGQIPVQPVNGRSTFAITVSFAPRRPAESTEKLEISTYIPNYSEECVLIGYGSLDERYHVPGM